MRTYAAIDIGTNSTRLLIAGVEGGRVYPQHSALEMSRLGEGMQTDLLLQPAAISRTVEALRLFRRVVDGYVPAAVDAVATSAARDALNTEDFLAAVAGVTGFKVRVLSGREEARLSYLGAQTALGDLSGRAVVVDIGGGSTELIYNNQVGELQLRSHAVGAVRCTEQGITAAAMLELMRPDLEALRGKEGLRLIGVGGTVTTLAAMEQRLTEYSPDLVHGYFLPTGTVERWRERLAAMPLTERQALPGLQPQRADIIVAGATILQVILNDLGVAGITASEADILHGMVLDLAAGGPQEEPGRHGHGH